MQSTEQKQDWSTAPEDWITGLDNVLRLTDETARPGMQARISCKLIHKQPSLILPPEMDELQPAVLNYLHALGAQHGITLIEERRVDEVIPALNRREDRPPNLALGISLLLKQTGLPGPAHSLSSPHMLRPENPRIDISQLIKIIAKVYKDAKRVVFLPNRFLTGNFADQSVPLTGYACKVTTGERKFTLCYFNAPEFHAVGYISNNQFVIHVFLAGGPICKPKIWSPYQTMTDAAFRIQLFKSAVPNNDFGLLYSTFFIDLEDVFEKEAWWNDMEPTGVEATE